ncbi:MAG: tetratricopeptide repeat protein [Acidobacteriia bacterium]|nr:tetratricopeptide repeat protein [Terriglobia bacterium]
MLAESERAVSLDPVSATSHNNRAMLLWRARRWDEAIEQAQVALDLDPSHVNALWWQGLAYAGEGDDPLALASLSKGFEASGAPAFLASLGYATGLAGEADQARSILARLEDVARERNASGWSA